MRKTHITPVLPASEDDLSWLNLIEIASVEITSEDPAHPVERALGCARGGGWRAAGGGEQRIRVMFDVPRPLKRIQLRFLETEVERTQEFALSWWDAEDVCRLIVRQQWNFSPTGSTMEFEDYHVDLPLVSKIELAIRPGSGSGHVASLDCWRMA